MTDEQIWDIAIETLRNSHTIKEKKKGEMLGEETLSLPEGKSVLRIVVDDGGINLDSLKIK